MAISSDTAHSLLWSGYFQTPDFGMTLMQSRAVACDLLGSLGRAMHRPWGWRNSFWKHQAVAVSCGWWTCCEEFCGTRLALICRYHQDARNSEGGARLALCRERESSKIDRKDDKGGKLTL